MDVPNQSPIYHLEPLDEALIVSNLADLHAGWSMSFQQISHHDLYTVEIHRENPQLLDGSLLHMSPYSSWAVYKAHFIKLLEKPRTDFFSSPISQDSL